MTIESRIAAIEDAIAGLRAKHGGANAGELQSRHVSAAAPSHGQVQRWNATTKKWEPWTTAVIVRKTADEAVASSATLQDDDHLKFALAANEAWAFEAFIIANGDSAKDIKFAFTVPSGATLMWSGLGLHVDAADETDFKVGYVVVASGTQETFGVRGSLVRAPYRLYGTVVNSTTAGDLQLQWAQRVSDATATTVFENSWLKGTQF